MRLPYPIAQADEGMTWPMFTIAVFYHRGERVWLECGVCPAFMLDQPRLQLFVRVLGEGPRGWVTVGSVTLCPYLPNPPQMALEFFRSLARPATLRRARGSRKPPQNLIGKTNGRRIFPYVYVGRPDLDTTKPCPPPAVVTLSGRPWQAGGCRDTVPPGGNRRAGRPDPVPF